MEKFIYHKNDAFRLETLTKLQDFIDMHCSNIDEFLTEYQVTGIGNSFSTFEKIKMYKESVRQQEIDFEQKYNDAFYKAKTYVVHYYMAMHMAIERGELPSTIATWYGLGFPFNIPNPRNGEDLLTIAKNLFTCDERRVAEGGRLLVNPNISSVKIWTEKFEEIHTDRMYRQNTKQAEVENIDGIRENADNLIFDIFKTIQERFADEEPECRNEILKACGFVVENVEKKQPKLKPKPQPVISAPLQYSLF